MDKDKSRARLLSKIVLDAKTGCWIWNGNPRKNGYCRSTFQRKNWYIHRASYHVFIGDIPKGYDVCHHCDNRRCFNPDHLFIGTRKDNMADAVKKGRQAKGEKLSVNRRGEKSVSSKLTNTDVLEIRKMNKLGVKTKEIALKFKVSADNIRRIIRRETWRHI